MKIELERINTLWFVTLGVTALAASILIYILLLESALGAFSIKEAYPGAATMQTETRVALLRSDYTKQAQRGLNPSDTSATWVDVTLRSWRDFLLNRSLNVPFREIRDADLEEGRLDDFDVLILPSARALSDQQIDQIKAFMERGGSVLATWAPGVQYPDGTWRGWSFVEEVFGVQWMGYVERGAGNYRIYQDTFPGTTPPGLYLPERLYQPSDDPEVQARRSRAQAEAQDFAPLTGYQWLEGITPEINTRLPQSDAAVAETLTTTLRGLDGEVRRQPAVAVTYYTWIGGTPGDQVPFPSTGTGIRRFTMRGNTPLTAGVPSGYRVKIQVYNPGVALRVVEDRTTPAGFWFDFATEDRLAMEAVQQTTGLVYGNYGRGRFVYMGFQRDAMGIGREDVEDYEVLSVFFSNVMRYLQRQPVIWVHDWPYPHDAGALITGEGHDELSNLGGVADVLSDADVQGTYFVRPEEAVPYATLVKRLYDRGDVGVLDDLRRDSDGSEEFQATRLARLQEQLESVVDGPVKGYRPATRGRVSTTTMGALTEADYSYFMPDSIGRRLVPKIMGYPYETLTRIGVTVHSDAQFLERQPDLTPDLWTTFISDDIQRVDYEASLFNLVYSSDILARPENRSAFTSIVRELKDRNFWITTADSMAHWWRLHQGLNVDVEQRGPSRIFVRVSNDNGHVAEHATISIGLGRPVADVSIRPELIEVFGEATPVPQPGEYRLEAGGTVLVIPIEHLKPQQYRIFHIDLLDDTGRPFLADN